MLGTRYGFTMPPAAFKKRKVSPLSKGNHSSVYAQDTIGQPSQDSSNEENDVVVGNGANRGGHIPFKAERNAKESWNSGAYDSSVIKLKANELLTKMRPDYERNMVKVENSLRKLKNIIERIPDREAKPVCSI